MLLMMNKNSFYFKKTVDSIFRLFVLVNCVLQLVRADPIFYLFAYGSNMLTERIHLIVPSAKFYDIGELKHAELAPGDYYSEKWKGVVYSFMPSQERSVWGVIWKVPLKAVYQLDRQGAVDKDIFQKKMVEIQTANKTMKCVTYWFPARLKMEVNEYLVSDLYKNILVAGAIEHNLPSEYVGYLKSLPTNGHGTNDKVEQYMLT